MNRKQFLLRMAQTCAGIGCCGIALSRSLLASPTDSPQTGQSWIRDFEKTMISKTETPPTEKMRKSHIWIRDLMSNMDSILDPDTRKKLMWANGRSCYHNAFGVASEEKPTPQQAEQVLQYFEKKGYEIKRNGDTTVVYYSWGKNHQNPWGLILGDGYCMCPVMENVKEKMSPTFCLCSAGYVQEIFYRLLGKPVTVNVLESVITGGQDCRFEVIIKES